MTYSSLMVHLDLGVSNEALLQLTAEMAERYEAAVIGITAFQPMQIAYGDGYMSGDVIEEDRTIIERQQEEAQDRFQTVLHNRASSLEWRSTIGYLQLADWIARQARAADLLLFAPEPKDSVFDASRRAEMGDVLMRIGRPVMVVPPSAAALDLKQVLIGWKDTGETRRAVWDALPLLRRAGEVTVVEIVEGRDELAATQTILAEVVAWLRGHGVTAQARAELQDEDGSAAQLAAIAADMQAGALVIGAYGHNRLREWILGGVTRDTLRHPARCSLLSH